MSANFTPGPWRINTGRNQDVFSADGREITVCNTQGAYPASQQDAANARLIAVAPDGYALAVAVAAHFTDTDAPLGKMARDFLEKVS